MTDGPSYVPPEAPSGWGPPLPPKPRKGRGKKIALTVGAVFGVLLIGFVVLVALAVNDTKKEYEDTAALAEGSCVSVTRMDTTDPGVAERACTAPDANYTIGVRLPENNANCPAGDYDVYQQGSRFGGNVTFCLVPIFEKGKCYLLNDAGTATVPCSGTGEDTLIRVEQVLAGETKKKACTKGNFALAYTRPATVFCASTLPSGGERTVKS